MKPEYRCKYCGAPSWLHPLDQEPPPDYCHESDHGEPPEPEPDAYCHTDEDGSCVSADPRCMHNAALMVHSLKAALTELQKHALMCLGGTYFYSGLEQEWATAVLNLYPDELLVEDLYAEDKDFASALNNLIGPDFEYPDWSHKTVGEVLEKYT